MAYRSAVNESTKHTRARVLFEREMRLPCDLVFRFKPGEDLVSKVWRKMDSIYQEFQFNVNTGSENSCGYTIPKKYEDCHGSAENLEGTVHNSEEDKRHCLHGPQRTPIRSRFSALHSAPGRGDNSDNQEVRTITISFCL